MTTGVTLVGLGPGGREYWTQTVYRCLHQASELYLRAVNLRDMADVTAQLHLVADKIQAEEDIEQAYRRIAGQIIALGRRPEGVVYAVPGHPAIDEPTFPYLRDLAEREQLPLKIIAAPSRLEATRLALNLTLEQSLQIIQAKDLAHFYHPPLAPDRPALITHCYQSLAAKIKNTLANAYHDDYQITLIRAARSDVEQQWSCLLSELAGQPDLDEQTTLYLPPDPANSSFTTFQNTIAHLRAPEGCPWDREQTHQTLRPFLLEETYEVLEALDAADPAALAEELGDLLLQIVLHTQIATDTTEFKMGQVIGHIQRKMLRRHPHVFGDVTVAGAAEVLTNWEAIKKAEKQASGGAAHLPSVLDGVPSALPALSQALTISKRVVRVGFEWPDIEGVLEKLLEEAQEITTAPNAANLETEIGDFLFSAVNLARWHNIDPESALRATNARFTRRFKRVEQLAAAQGKLLPEMTLDEMERLWVEAKRVEG